MQRVQREYVERRDDSKGSERETVVVYSRSFACELIVHVCLRNFSVAIRAKRIKFFFESERAPNAVVGVMQNSPGLHYGSANIHSHPNAWDIA